MQMFSGEMLSLPITKQNNINGLMLYLKNYCFIFEQSTIKEDAFYDYQTYQKQYAS